MDFINNFLDLDFEGMKYRFFIPKSETKKLILHMHGSAGRGNDNIKNLNYMDAAGFHTVIDKNLAFILAPQVQENKKFFDIEWKNCIYNQNEIIFDGFIKKTYDLLLKIIKEYDIKEVYIEGYSMGGYATYELSTRYPNLFKGIIGICGGVPKDKIKNIKNSKIVIVHGEDDHVVPKEGSLYAYETLKKEGANVTLHLLKNTQHNSWDHIYQDKDFIKDFIK